MSVDPRVIEEDIETLNAFARQAPTEEASLSDITRATLVLARAVMYVGQSLDAVCDELRYRRGNHL